MLGIAERRRRFDELSLPRFAAWGAVGGVLLSLVPAAMVAVGLASIGGADTAAVGLTEDERLESQTCTSRGESPAQRLPKSCSTRAMRSIPKCSATRSRTVARVPTRSASWAGIVT